MRVYIHWAAIRVISSDISIYRWWKKNGGLRCVPQSLIKNVSVTMQLQCEKSFFEKFIVTGVVKEFSDFRDSKIHYHIHKGAPLNHIPIQLNPIHTVSVISIFIILTFVSRFPKGLFPSGFHTNILYLFSISPTGATCPHISSSLI
jgi:hypothetical protein